MQGCQTKISAKISKNILVQFFLVKGLLSQILFQMKAAAKTFEKYLQIFLPTL